MISIFRKRFFYTALLCGLVLGTVLIIIINSFRHLDNPFLSIGSQFLAIIFLSLVTGRSLKNSVAHSYTTTFTALFYTYALSGLFMFTQTIHYGLYVLIMGLATVGFFYISNWFFNRLRIHTVVKIIAAIPGFIVIFFASSLLGIHILRLISAS